MSRGSGSGWVSAYCCFFKLILFPLQLGIFQLQQMPRSAIRARPSVKLIGYDMRRQVTVAVARGPSLVPLSSMPSPHPLPPVRVTIPPGSLFCPCLSAPPAHTWCCLRPVNTVSPNPSRRKQRTSPDGWELMTTGSLVA